MKNTIRVILTGIAVMFLLTSCAANKAAGKPTPGIKLSGSIEK